MESKALEVNLACTRVDVTVDNRFNILSEVMGEYEGVRSGLQNFLKEICHPYRNWQYIVKEARSYALNYFHVLQTHPRGAEAAAIYFDIFFSAITESQDLDVRRDATDHLLLFAQHIIREGDDTAAKWQAILDRVFDRIREYPDDTFFLFVKSYYQLSNLGKSYARILPGGGDCTPLNRLLSRYFRFTYQYWLRQEDPLVWFENESGEKVRGGKLAEIVGHIGQVNV